MSSTNKVTVASYDNLEDELDDVYSDWSNVVNMTADELRRWSKNPCSREASEDPVSVIRRNLRLLETNKSDWDSNDISDAKRTISFVERMSSDDNRPESPMDGSKGCPTPWAISLLNWAHNPFDSLPEHPEDLDSVDEVTLESGMDTPQITAYEVEPSTEELELEEGQMVRIDDDAYEEANIDRLQMEEETDEDHEYEKLGFIIETHTDDFNWIDVEEDAGMTVEVDDGDVVHIVGLSHTNAGAHPFFEDELEPVDRDNILGDMDIDGDPEDIAEEDDQTEVDEEENWDSTPPIVGTTTVEELAPVNSPVTDRGNVGPPWPPSWEKSNKPARLIAMDAYISMGRSFRGCRRTMVKSGIRNPNRFCARYKDSIYGHTYWREGGG